jgi:hypothetical protein
VPALPPSNPDRRLRRRARSVRPLVAGAALLTALLALAACGGGSKTTSTPTTAAAAQRGRGGFGFAQDPKVRACLQKQGVTLPTGGAGRGGPRNGRPPGGAGGRRFNGGTGPTGAGGPAGATGPTGPAGPNGRGGGLRRDPAQFAKLQAAMKACGVQVPARRPGTGPTGPSGPQNQPAPNAGTS